MDVHSYNSRALKNNCTVLVHVGIPSTLLQPLVEKDISELGAGLYVECRTVRTDGTCSRVLNVGNKISSDPSFTKNKSGYVVLTSVPLLFVDDKGYNGLDVAILRFKSLQTRRECDVKIFYITLINVLKRTEEDGAEGDPPDVLAAGPDPLEEMIKKNSGQVPRAKEKDDSPRAFLKGLLNEVCGAAAVGKHHPALENPGAIRAAATASSAEGKSQPRARVNRKFSLALHRNGRLREVIECKHLLTQIPFFMYLYEENVWSSRYIDIFQFLPSSEFMDISPVVVIESRERFLFRKQKEFVNSLLAGVYERRGEVTQRLPISLQGDINYMSLLMVVACQRLIFQEHETYAWTRALLQRNRGQGLWLEVIDLWSTAAETSGREVRFLSGVQLVSGADPDWIALIKDEVFRETVRRADLCSVLVSPGSLDAWLILPGGFVIKGKYTVTEEETLFLRRHYGFFEETQTIS